MSKKNKIQKKNSPPVTVRSSDVKFSKELPDKTSLIFFDKKTKLFFLILVAAYLLLSLLKIHTSNIANWDTVFGKDESESVIAGKPRFIRSDEWIIVTPSTLSQYQLGMPVKNEGLGAENTAVVMGLPVKDMSTLLRPNLWPYFIFDEEHAFAFSWNFNIFLFLISTFLLFMLLTRNNFWLSVFGSFFIFFSSGVQWWSYGIGNQMMYLNGMVISFIYILYHKKLWPLILSGIFLLLSVHSFLFNLYPPFQVPLVYLYLFLFTGFLLQRKNFKGIKEKLLLKTVVLSVVLIILAVFLYHYYNLVKDTYTMMLNTVYPGRRFSVGGDLISGKLFSEFFGMFMSDTHFPNQWQNICEESGFIMFFPIIFYALGYHYFKSKKMDPLLLSLSIYIVIGLVYVLIGFPAFLSKMTLFSMSPSFRALPIIEAGNCILLVCYLGNKQTEQNKNNFSWIESGILTISIFMFIRIASSHINKVTDNFFTSEQINIVTILFTLVYLLIRYKHFRFAKPLLYLLLSGITIHNIAVNPLTKGLSPVLENPLVKTSKDIHVKDPKARWAVFGNKQWVSPRLANLLKVNGINVFNGVKFVPPLKDMAILNTAGNDSAYNRYANIDMQMYINWKDTVIIKQTFYDEYTIFIDPCSPRLKQLKVKYIVFSYKPRDTEIRCMTKVGETSGIFIYKRNDQ